MSYPSSYFLKAVGADMMQLTLIFLVLFFGICDPDFWIRSSSFDCGSAYLKHSFHVIHSHSLVLQGVQEKLCFFTIHCNPSPAYIAVRDLQSSQRNAVYNYSYWLVIFCTTNSSRVLARERWQTFENSWKKTQYLMNTL